MVAGDAARPVASVHALTPRAVRVVGFLPVRADWIAVERIALALGRGRRDGSEAAGGKQP